MPLVEGGLHRKTRKAATKQEAERNCAGEALEDTIVTAELHWYEVRGVGRRELKIERLLD